MEFKIEKSKLNISLEDVVLHLPANVYWLNRENVYLGCNELYAVFAGLKDRNEIIGKTNYDMPWRDQADTFNRINNQVMSTGQECSLEQIAIQADGTELVFLSKKVPLFDNKANIVGVLGMSFDITKQKEAERKLIDAKEKTDLALENTIAHLPGHVYWLDKNNIFLGCNKLQAEFAGFRSWREMVGKSNYDMPWREHADALNRVNDHVMSTGQEYSVEEVAKQGNGTEITFLSKKVPLLDSKGNTIGILGISFDITKQKEAEHKLIEAKEKAEAANKAKTEFLENMRHDIRTPLSAMIGFSELLMKAKKSSEIHEIQKYALGFSEAAKELLRFLNDVLESLNVASGDIPLLKNKFCLFTVLSNVIKLHQPVSVAKDLSIDLDFDESIPKYLIGDPVRIYRIVLELLVNALKFTQRGYVKINAKLAKKESYDLVVMIEVEDTGSGIPLEKQSELLLRFKRLTPSYQGIYKGTGLGLSIVKQFIDDLKGEIYIESKLNEGTKFICLLPIKESLLAGDRGECSYSTMEVKPDAFFQNNQCKEPKNNKNTNFSRNISVLIVEDHEFSAIVGKNILVDAGFQVDIAIDGESAISMFKENHYDFILMDIGLPTIDGYETTREIRSHELILGYRRPIIGLSAHIDVEKQQQGIISGMNVVLAKPLTQELMATILNDYIGYDATNNDDASGFLALVKGGLE